MFGYIRINKPELKVKEYYRYRAFYCGLCRVLQKKFGLFGEFTLTYDMTFLVMLLNSLYACEETKREIRCEANPLAKHTVISSEATAYGADMNLLLAYYKQLDDWQDERKLKGKAFSLVLSRKVQKMMQQYPRQAEAVRRELECLKELEQKDCRDYNLPADAFGRMLGEIFIWQEDFWKDSLYQIGFSLGRFIYLADAWDDLKEDQIQGGYNPLKDSSLSLEDMRKILMESMASCARVFEQLPVVDDAETLRNIIYAGVWTRFGKEKKREKHAAG